MAKSQDAFRTISEVSDWLDTPAHVLRFWESKFPQIKPVKRAGGRRYYRPDDMALLSGIKTLLHDQGMTIKGVQKLLREQGVRHVIDIGVPPSPGGTPLDGDWQEGEGEVEANAVAEPMTGGHNVQADQPPAAPTAPNPTAPNATAPDPTAPAPTAPETVAPAPTPTDPWPAPPSQDAANAAPPDDADAPDDARVPVAPDATPASAPREVSQPFVRARAEAAEPPASAPRAEILAFAPRPRPPIPTIPDERGYSGRPGALTALTGGDRAAVRASIRANATRITPLVARLKVVADRLSNPRD